MKTVVISGISAVNEASVLLKPPPPLTDVGPGTTGVGASGWTKTAWTAGNCSERHRILTACHSQIVASALSSYLDCIINTCAKIGEISYQHHELPSGKTHTPP